MKQALNFFVGLATILSIYGVAGSLELDTITIGQAAVRIVVIGGCAGIWWMIQRWWNVGGDNVV